MPIALSDHTAGLEGVRLAGKAASDLLKLTVRGVVYVAPRVLSGVQWNLSNPDTLGTEESVLISEVS